MIVTKNNNLNVATFCIQKVKIIKYLKIYNLYTKICDIKNVSPKYRACDSIT